MQTVLQYQYEIKEALQTVEVKLIIINDGTTWSLKDDFATLKQAVQHEIIIINLDKNYGKGYATRKGIETSNADHIIFTDVDFPYSTNSLVTIYNKLITESRDVVLGVRDNHYYDTIPRARKKISTLLRKANQRLFNLITPDTQCGLKGMNKKGKEVLLQTKENRYLFDLEFVKMISRTSSIVVGLQEVKLRDGVSFSKIPLTKILGELLSYFRILIAQ